ncbi:MAG: hypothetical protein KF910_05995 [Brevundimonas sp.]|uniref:DUF6498-containing protein n=1 Tax=Brevundimonas sp. TaxID=1871086 RepID=UPI0025BE9C3F|nr:DUF6498-containing protein [Brevundimonas sp.]MBX3477136.1 hypothetical protein [Brevundimonas sp.]
MLDLRRLLSGPGWALSLILAGNLIPVFGVAFLGWDAAQILLLYWAENVVVGFLTVPRILAAEGGRRDQEGSPAANGCFFSVHYGVFCIGHLVFALSMANDFARVDGQGGVWSRTFGDGGFWLAILAIALLHLIGQVRDWWMKRAWRDASPMMEMFRPYGRIVVLHITVLLGAWLMLALKAPAWTVLLLCLGKALLEVIGAVATGRLARS